LLLVAVLAMVPLPVSISAANAQTAGCPCSIWSDDDLPAIASVSDSDAVELGVKFQASEDGYITGIRFYKGAANTGVHVGRLWKADGTLLAAATFVDETVGGWQQVLLPSPVEIDANTTYVASYHAPAGHYAFTSGGYATGTTRGPLTGLQSETSGGNGVYRYGAGGVFPTSSWNASNYWVDVVFTQSLPPDTTAPTVTGRTPGPDQTGVDTGTNVTATFSEPIQPDSAQVSLTGPTGSVPGSKEYNESTRTLTFTPAAALAASSTYTVSLSGAQDAAGNTMTTLNWSFTTVAGPPPPAECPCTIWPDTAAPAIASASDDSAIELGVKFQASENGFIKGLRFFKGFGNTGPHVGTLWLDANAELRSVTFPSVSAAGWQTAYFDAPVPISAGTTYVASYYTPAGHYAVTSGGFAGGSVSRGPLTALQNGVDGPNGVYKYGAHGFPTETYESANYWVDVVFDQDAVDTSQPTILNRVPEPNASDVSPGVHVAATFSEPVRQSTIAFELRGPGNNLVPASLAYESSGQVARLSPNLPLAYSTTYTAHLSGVEDNAGNLLPAVSWSFTTEAAPPPPPDQGPGGPIAVLSSSSDRFTRYTAEILRAEGLNSFATLDVASVTPATLASYDVAVLGSMPLTPAQVTMLTDWVDAGGNLIAYKPDPQLASLLGLTSAGGAVSDDYLRVNTAQAPGAGITSETMQFHGIADLYNLNGATSVATLYSDAATETTHPAVTLRSVGSNGGQAAAFTYDLAKSIVYTRQGNPAWAAQERDGDEQNVIRSDDMYFGGGVVPDWVDLSKVMIPQADEQQRLLANLVQVMNRDRKPLPRFWYFPDGRKAVVVATGDDHGNPGGTKGRFDEYDDNSPANCSVADWECLRFTSYVYPNTPLTTADANTADASGFEVGAHVQNDCSNFASPGALATTYEGNLAAWRAVYPNLPDPVSNRFHCMVWSDWSSQAKAEIAKGIRLDVNYYYWPGFWIKNRPGFMTGSGMPMRFADGAGTMLDVYQATTQLTDESGQSYPFTPDTLLGNALGSLGYYGAFTTNMHTDDANTTQNDLLMATAQLHHVPMITARQLLTWLDGRNASSFQSVGWSGDQLTFTLEAGAGANGLQAMVPTAGPGAATLSGLTRGGSSVNYTLQTIKGLEYAVFPAVAGSYTATYSSSGGLAAPQIASATVSTAGDGTAELTWRTNEPATSEVVFGPAAESLGGTSVEAGASRTHAITLDKLRPGATYYYRVRSRDLGGTRTTWPPTSQEPLAFTMPKQDKKAPGISAVETVSLPDGTATVTWRTNEPATSAVVFGTSAGKLDERRIDDKLLRQHQIVLTDLQPGRSYWYRVESVDTAGNRAAAPNQPQPFVSAAAGVADHTAAKFRMGERNGVVVEAASASSTGRLVLSGKQRTGRYVSRVMDAGAMVTWDRGGWQASVPEGGALRVYVRTGSTSSPDGTWTSWRRLSGQGDVIASEGRYLQYRIELAGGGGGRAPKLSGIGFTHNGRPPAQVGETSG
jgi:hypothetical protein